MNPHARTTTAALVACWAVATASSAQTPADSAAIVATALNYIEGWYEGNGDRMDAALHPAVAKRIAVPGTDGQPDRFSHMNKQQLVDYTRRGGGSDTPATERRIGVRILDIFENTAAVRVDASEWVDHLQIFRIDGEWKIINVLWGWRPESLARRREAGHRQ